MERTIENRLLAIEEQVFLQLLDNPGTVEVRVGQVGSYFVPFVYFTPPNTAECELRGVIMRNKGMFAATSRQDLVGVLLHIAGETGLRCTIQEEPAEMIC